MKPTFPIINSIPSTQGSKTFVEIPKNCPYFRGHFPGRPILPAVSHLVMLTQIYRQESQGKFSISKIEFFRIYQNIGPGETVSISIKELSNGKTHFRIQKDDTLVSRGTVIWTGGKV